MTDQHIDDEDEPGLAGRRQALAALSALLPALLAAPAAKAQNAAAVQPQSYKVVLENDYVRVLEYNSRPGMSVCGAGRHSHPAHVTVPLTPGKVRIHVGGKEIIAANGVGDAFWEDAVTHEVENISGANMRAIMVEIKTPARRS